MGIIRGGLLAIISVLLFISILAGNLLLTISWSLNYNNVQEKLTPVIKDVLRDEIGATDVLKEKFPQMQTYCVNNPEYIFTYRERVITIPCSVVGEGEEKVIDYGIGKFIEDIYYHNYECNFWDCFKTEGLPLFLVSSKAQVYWYTRFNYILMAIGILSALGFIFAQRKSNFFILLSFLIILASLPLAKFDFITSLIGEPAESLLNVFFSRSYDVFFRVALIGAAFLALGLILKFFRIGFKISTIFAKKEGVSKEEVKKIIKEEKTKDASSKFGQSKEIVKKEVKKEEERARPSVISLKKEEEKIKPKEEIKKIEKKKEKPKKEGGFLRFFKSDKEEKIKPKKTLKKTKSK